MKKAEVEIISPTTTVEAIEKALDTPAIDPVVLSVANDYLSGKSISDIADSYALSEDRVAAIIEKKDKQAWVVFQTNNYKDLNSHINCWPTAQLFAESLNLEWVACVKTLELNDFNRFMVIGK